MPNRILKAEGWQQRIRSKLGVDAAYLPDSDIEQPDVITVAEAKIIEQISDYGSLQGDKLVYLEAAVVCECAALLSLSMPARLPKKEAGPHENHEVDVDWNKRKVELEVERDGYIGMIVPSSPLPHFGLSQ